MVAPRSSTTNSPRFGRQYRGNRRAVDAGQRAQAKSRHRHQRAGIAGRDRDIGLALLDRFDRQPHRRDLAAAPQRLARLVVHADGDIGMDDAGGGLQRGMLFQLGIDLGAVAEQQEFGVAMSVQCKSAAPGMTTEAPTSPPMASSAIRTFCGMNVPET